MFTGPSLTLGLVLVVVGVACACARSVPAPHASRAVSTASIVARPVTAEIAIEREPTTEAKPELAEREVEPPVATLAPLEALARALCAARVGCELGGRVGGLTTASGESREVWRVTLPELPADEDSCTMEEFWLVARDVKQRVLEQRMFAQGCTAETAKDAWCGLPPRAKVRVREKRVEADWEAHAMRCMSVYHSRGSHRASLETFAPLDQSSTYFRMTDVHEETRESWDYQRQRGSRRFSVWGSSGCKPLLRGPAWRIPRANVPEEFLESGWQRLGMAGCATTIDDQVGYASFGSKARVRLRLLLAQDDSLFVELESKSGVPPKAGVVRVCYAESAGYTYAYCESPSEVTCADIALDGSVKSGELSVERAPARLLYKIALPNDVGGLTVAYLDPAARRSLATSRLRETDYTTLGDLFTLPEGLVACEARDDALELRFTPVGGSK